MCVLWLSLLEEAVSFLFNENSYLKCFGGGGYFYLRVTV